MKKQINPEDALLLNLAKMSVARSREALRADELTLKLIELEISIKKEKET